MGRSETILIVDDEQDLLDTLAYRCREAGYRPLLATKGEEALHTAARARPALVVLDLMLPDVPGTEVCRRLQTDAATRHIPVVMLTACGEEIDRVVGFELGASDYVVKPFSSRELMLRIRAVLRRVGPVKPSAREQALRLGAVRVDPAAHRVLVDERDAGLTLREFRLLEVLVRRRGHVLSREELLDAAWPDDVDVMERSVDALVMRIRSKLGPAAGLLETVRGVGYRARTE
ncbi:MAG: response regulator [Myxococcota bacterium]